MGEKEVLATEINLKLTVAETNTLLQCLESVAYGVASPIITKLVEQGEAAIRALQGGNEPSKEAAVVEVVED